jgi:hypothetical protein
VTLNAICPGDIDDERIHENAKFMAETTGQSMSDILKTLRRQCVAH